VIEFRPPSFPAFYPYTRPLDGCRAAKIGISLSDLVAAVLPGVVSLINLSLRSLISIEDRLYYLLHF
jgi:hypothetical protein